MIEPLPYRAGSDDVQANVPPLVRRGLWVARIMMYLLIAAFVVVAILIPIFAAAM